ncbi:LOW QUALITY PROTEIN: gasdermin Eb [Acanthochromis polyacanthus]|uniref:LOW QUALITY PROTEIN: gasdermin Eb n=1 Tax=Acanthochromis polyacanthus TaxID=80966 RepID=UPI002234060F|nr:LOW QUALITY PROTEIN: gasdermin Eb [Acanthochromis polyacanthus]
MFANAARNFVEEVDHGGLLIPVSGLNDSIAPLTVVLKRKRFWFWQKHKYHPTDFNLNDLLTGDAPIKPVVVVTDFIKYTGTFGGNIEGGLEASLVRTNASVGGKDSSKLQSSFGSLKKEEVDVQKLLRDSKDRVLDMSHGLIQQTKEKPRQLLGIVKERIVTTQPCSVIEEVQQGGQCGGSLSVCGPKSSKLLLKENGSLSKDSNVTMEIPINTTIAYGLIELEIKHDGHYELCLMSNTDGGFEVDGPAKKGSVSVCRAPAHSSEIATFDKCKRSLQFSRKSLNFCYVTLELEQLGDHFQLLSALPASTRLSLLEQITKLMQDQAAISALENVLDHMRLGKKLNLSDVTANESQQQNIQVILDVLEQLIRLDQASPQPTLTALHLITSALDEMTNDCLAALGTCCSPAVLQTLELLVQTVCGDGEEPLSSAGLTEDVYEKTERLFALSNVSLKRAGTR